jgi:hypothetical protein
MTSRRLFPALLIATCALLPAALCGAAAAAPPEPSAPQLAFEPGGFDFGLQEANRSNSQTWLQLRNNGAAAAQVLSLEIVGSGSNAFWINGGDCYNGRTLNPGESCSVQVGFGPYDAIPFEAQLRANSEEGSTFTADLNGEGGRAVIGPSVDPTNFGSVPVGAAPAIKTIDLTNSGNMPGGLFIAVIAGGAIGSFHLLDENCTGIPLNPDATCNLQVSFQPISTGAKTARLGLFGDSDGGTQVMLTGVGLEPEPEPSPVTSDSETSVRDSASGRRQGRSFKSSKPRRRTVLRRHSLRAALGAHRPIG